MAKNFLCQADKLREEHSYKDAVTIYLNAILLNRKDINSYYGLGLCYKELKNYTKAIKNFEKAAEINPDFYEVFYEMGICHIEEGVPGKAIKNFVRAIQINPENPNAILQLGIAHELCDENDMALMIYQKLIENSPAFIKAYEQKSRLLIKFNRYNDAFKTLLDLIKTAPDHAQTYFDMASCLEKMGNLKEAQRYYRKFLQQKPVSKHVSYAKNRLEKLKLKSNTSKYLSLV